MLIRVFGLAVAAAGIASAQFSGLAATGDASEVYFATGLRLRSEISLNLPPTTAIYRVRDGVIERVTDPPPFIAGNPHLSDGNAQVSGDGRVFSYTEYATCFGGSYCIDHPSVSSSYLVDGQRNRTPLAGEAQVSANGRWAANTLRYGFTFPQRADVRELHDLETGATYTLGVWPSSARQAVTSDGRVLGFDVQTGELELWSPRSSSVLSTAKAAKTAIANDTGSAVVYETADRLELRGFETLSGRDVLLASRSSAGFDASISYDGALVLYIGEDGQLWTVRPDGSSAAQLTNVAGGVDTAVLAGAGTVAVAVAGGRILSINTSTRTVSELIGPTPTCNYGFTALIPGSILPVRGSMLADATVTAPIPLPSELAGVRILADGSPLPLLKASPTEVWFQVPFELKLQPAVTVEVDRPESAFAGCEPRQFAVVERAPYFFDYGTLVAAHQDFSGLVTETPARPGEIIHAYAVGLGAVQPPMTTGMPTPTDRLFRLAAAFDCHTGVYAPGEPLDVTFAGLAPGMIGIYQVDVRMPAVAPEEGVVFVNCGTPGDPYARGGGFVNIR